MQRLLSVVFTCVFGIIVFGGCDIIKKGGTGSPTGPSQVAPSGAPVVPVANPRVVIELGLPTNRQANKYSGKLRGLGGVRDLIDTLPLKPGESFNTAAGESWSGTNARFIDWANSSAGAAAQTAIPFEFGKQDLFEVPSIPPLYFANATKAVVDFTIELVPGGQLDGNGRPKTGNLRVIPVEPSEGTVQVIAPLKPDFKYRYERDAQGRVHIKSDTLPY